MSHTFKPALICTLTTLLLAACGGGSDETDSTRQDGLEADGSGLAKAQALSTTTSPSFSDELLAFDTTRWHAANWSNGAPFVNGWHPGQLSFVNGRLGIRLEADTAGLTGKPAVSGEYRTNGTYKYGSYKARFMASRTPGTISGFFTYTGPSEGTQHDEIDFEIKGDDPTYLQVNYWTAGVEHKTDIKLGFDAAADFHDYEFRWTATGIQWFVDGVLVHQENGSGGPLPVTAGRIMLNHWGTVGASPWSSDYVVSTTPSLMSVERVGFTSETVASPAQVSVGALSGSAYADGKGWRAAVSIRVKDSTGAAVPGALVTGRFTVGGSPVSCTSASTGTCSITSARIGTTTASTTFAVTSISGTNMAYDSTRNAAASVVIAKP